MLPLRFPESDRVRTTNPPVFPGFGELAFGHHSLVTGQCPFRGRHQDWMLFVGFDGGGTKCEGFVIDADGVEWARASGGSTNTNSVGWDVAERHFEQVAELLRTALGEGCAFGGACLGMSGVDREPERRRWTEVASRVLRLPEGRVRVSNDAVTALAAGTSGALCGVAVIAGTGTIALAMSSPAGPAVRAQGWGPALGDEGSGYAVGQDVLRAVAQAHDGAAPATRLTALVLAATSCSKPEELVAWAYGPTELPWARVAALAPLAEQAAAEGDAAATALLDKAAAALAAAVRACVARCGGLPRPPAVVFSGGLLRQGSPVAARLAQLLGDEARMVHPAVTAAEAAALIARHVYISL